MKHFECHLIFINARRFAPVMGYSSIDEWASGCILASPLQGQGENAHLLAALKNGSLNYEAVVAQWVKSGIYWHFLLK